MDAHDIFIQAVRSQSLALDEDRLVEIAQANAAGQEVVGWRMDSRGIMSCRVNNGIFRNPAAVCNLIYYGFEPGCGSIDMYIRNRVVRPSCVKVQRRTLKRLAANCPERFTLRVDSDWDQVVGRVQEHTWTSRPGDCWLTDDLAASLKAARDSANAREKNVAFHSVELWLGDELMAANIGYTIGCVYSGFTKFYLKTDDKRYSGLGIMMTSALAAWLHRRGFKLYAMGSDAPYKSQGVLCDSYLLDGVEWLNEIKTARTLDIPPSLLPQDGLPVDVSELIGDLELRG